jgi:hypothetical protein
MNRQGAKDAKESDTTQDSGAFYEVRLNCC